MGEGSITDFDARFLINKEGNELNVAHLLETEPGACKASSNCLDDCLIRDAKSDVAQLRPAIRRPNRSRHSNVLQPSYHSGLPIDVLQIAEMYANPHGSAVCQRWWRRPSVYTSRENYLLSAEITII